MFMSNVPTPRVELGLLLYQSSVQKPLYYVGLMRDSFSRRTSSFHLALQSQIASASYVDGRFLTYLCASPCTLGLETPVDLYQ